MLTDPIPAEGPPQPLFTVTIHVFKNGCSAGIGGQPGLVLNPEDIIKACGWGSVLLVQQITEQAQKPHIAVANGWRPPAVPQM